VKHVLFPLAELAPGQMRAVVVDNVSIVVVRTPDGDVRALRNSCSHYGAKLSDGTVEPLVVGEGVGTYRIDPGAFVVRCPWHGYEFDVVSGQCPADPRGARVRAYRLDVEEGSVVLQR
jgi:3-phenylpropionate/trans-cinnamate dioxygenase ferredoxin subunit